MKSTLNILLCCLFVYSVGYSQQIYVETGFSGASFENFMNSSGENTIENKLSVPYEIGLGTGILFNHYKEVLKLSIGVNYNNYKINTIVNNSETRILLVYDFSFFSLKTGFEITFLHISKAKFKIHGNVSHSWLSQGSLQYENEFIDLRTEDGEFYKTHLNYHYGGDIEYPISQEISIYASYDIRKSLKKNEAIDEPYQIRAKTISLGLLFNIEK